MDTNVDPQANARLTRLLIIALLAAAVIFILRQIWDAISPFTSVFLLFALAWLIAFMVSPVTNYLTRHPIPPIAIRLLRRRLRGPWISRLDAFHLPHAVSVVTVYMLILVGLAVLSIYAIPALVGQLLALGQSVPKFIQWIPGFLQSVQADLAVWGVQIDLSQVYQPAQLAQRAEAISSQIVQLALNLATSLASALVNILLVLTLSLYMNLDGPRLSRQLRAIIPDHYQGRINLVGQSLSRTFGGFMRGQLLIAVLYGLPATVIMAAVGINLAAVIGTICGLLMLVPLIGAPIAMVLPALVALIQSPQDALWLFVVMTVYQQVLTQILAPKVMADVLGLPPLFVLLSIMVSMRMIGFWGLVFGIPLAGVFYALSVAYLEQGKIRREALPRGAGEGATANIFRLTPVGPGCLIIPDIESSPGELRSLAAYLSGRGVTTLGIDPYRSQGTAYWEDWYSAVLPALDQLWHDCKQVFIVGKGVGALLGLHAASELPIAGLCAMAPPLTRDGLYNGQEWQTGAVDAGAGLPAVTVSATSLRAATSHLQERVHGELAQVGCPTLIVHPRDHPTIGAEDVRYILERLGTAHKRIEWLELKADEEALWERVGQVVFAFFRNYIQ